MFVIINKDGMKINADANVKNLLTKECVIKDLFGILAIVNVNVIDELCDVGEYLDHKNSKCRKRLFIKLVEECSNNIDEKELHPNKMI